MKQKCKMTENLWRRTQSASKAQHEKIMDKKDKYNSSGCLDMTAFLAMCNIEREEIEHSKAKSSDKRKKRHKSKQRRKQCHS